MHDDIMAALARYDQALHDKDFEALGECYEGAARIFDIGDQLEGYAALHQLWDTCAPYFPNPIVVHRKDLQIEAGAEVAVVTCYSRVTGMAETDSPSARSWFRCTTCLRRSADGWKIIHEHVSLPVDCGAEKPAYILDEV